MSSPSQPNASSRFIDPFLASLHDSAPENTRNDPNYFAATPSSLLTTTHLDSFSTGTGSALYSSLTPLLESTAHELILVTCFWAPSATLDILNVTLRALSDKAVRRGTTKIRVRICFSSSSLWQKLFHSQSPTGQEYTPSTWVKKLRLPDPSELGGLDLRIKSVFMLPFSVMHPKFIVIDRKVVVLPSCNISWEEWFEGAAVMRGPIVEGVLRFYWEFWERREHGSPLAEDADADADTHESLPPLADPTPHPTHTTTSLPTSNQTPTTALLLPSPHHRNPSYQPFTSSSLTHAPPTPLNVFLLTLFTHAKHSIRIQTPNLTAPPVLSALLAALARGVDVNIVTSERLMILEQLVTAGTTTSRCVKTLVKRYKALHRSRSGADGRVPDEETALAPRTPGHLHIAYYTPANGLKKRGEEDGEPQQSHLKMTAVDGEVVVLGSGNLDRASWWTSQELGVAFFGKEVVEGVLKGVGEAMQGRARDVFNSEGGK
jgi:phosphatidylserine/phosphatidylglycerophosphate/cardiolipin synthase-like enzyme